MGVVNITWEIGVVAVEQIGDDFKKDRSCRGVKINGFNLATLVVGLIVENFLFQNHEGE